jgi:NDP-sugar pyrophosphorylase family protein
LQRAIATDDALGTLHQGEWEDIGTPERLQVLDTRLRQRLETP